MALLTVMVVLLLSTLLLLWASRTALFNEMVTGNDSDYQRTLEAAHAMVRDAEFDIQQQRPDGSACASAGFTGCRADNTSIGRVRFPSSESEFDDLHTALAAQVPSCRDGVCVVAKVRDGFWTQNTGAQGLDAMKKVGSTYGRHTGAIPANDGNPLLKSGATVRAWYWIEVLPYDSSAAISGGAAHAFAPDGDRPFVYRITAVAQGLKTGTQATVQSTLVWRKVGS